ncbi:uncharacterized protein FIBRA_02677 [Fibroporia radiculosa]|uniref:RRM domain-containing protein n=1 Tax=Fibroporia radiculosa TaxID=599839 RepID=J4GN15_9APHY|nr:uncharacterized protein FIBRA_02677 [Fibroporia radiculosa]CCM00640.1 predicted protein [Fibroporia radiculosa]
MTVRGLGSIGSPIVISDDEETAAYMERQLARLETVLQPNALLPYNWQSQPEMTDLQNDEMMTGSSMLSGPKVAVTGQKRKRGNSSQTDIPQVDIPPVESRTARKKRRRKEKQLAQSQGPTPVPPPTANLPLPIKPPVQASRKKAPAAQPVPEKYVPHNVPEILPPVSWSSYASVPSAPPAGPPLIPSLPLKPSALTASLGASLVNAHASGSAPPVRGNSHLTPSPSTYPADSQDATATSASADASSVKPKKIIGMSSDGGTQGTHGLFTIAQGGTSVPNPSRTLVLELLPKKFRNLAFVRNWAHRFAKRHLRVEMDSATGKALVEFPHTDKAQAAFNSPRLFGEGKDNIRAWWFRPSFSQVSAVNDLEEGEIEEDVGNDNPPDAQVSGKKKVKEKQKQKQKATKKKAADKRNVPVASTSALSPEPVDEDALLSALFGRSRSQNYQDMLASWPNASAFPPASLSQSHAGNAFMASSIGPPFPVVNSFMPSTTRSMISTGTSFGYESSSVDRSVPVIPSISAHEFSQAVSLPMDEEQAMDLESENGGYDASLDVVEQEASGTMNEFVDDNFSIASSRASEPPLPSHPLQTPLAAETTSYNIPMAEFSDDIPAPPEWGSTGDPVSPAAVVSIVPTPTPSLEPVPPPIDSTTVVLQKETLTPLAREATFTQPPSDDVGPPSRSLVPGVKSISPPLYEKARDDEPFRTFGLTKQALLDRQIALEKHIARAKLELALKQANNGGGAPVRNTHSHLPLHPFVHGVTGLKSSGIQSAPEDTRSDRSSTTSLPATRPPSATGIPKSVDSEPEDAMYGSTFTPVLLSSSTLEVTTPISTPVMIQAPPRDCAVESRDPTIKASVSLTRSEVTLDELAVSFITETLQTIHPPTPISTPAPTPICAPDVISTSTPALAPALRTSSAEKMALAAKQQRLEQYIAETKALMAKLGEVRSKEEKDQILRVLRERSR